MNNCAVKGRKLKEYNTSWFRRDSMVSSTSNIGRKFGYGKKFIPSIRMTCDMISPPPLPLGFLKFAKAIRCTLPNCLCECFAPGKLHLRTCETCKHGWVTHALDKLGYQHIFNMGMQVEIVQPNIVFDIASLMLYGSQATPIRLKILLDRLFSVLQHDEVLQVLHGFGWSYEDYARGYILQDASGRVLDKWSVATREEEHIILQQFLRFGETKSIAQEIILQDTKEKQDLYVKQTAKAESEIKKFIERSNLTMQSYMRPYESRHLFSSRLPFVPTSNRLITPPALHGYTPTTPPRDLRPPSIPPVPTSSPLTSSPLGRLQTMQPFDFRREPISPAVSPGLSEKHASRQPSGGESPKNLSTTPTPTPASNSPPQFQSQKLHEGTDSIAMPSINPPTVITQEDPPVNAINYSTKDCEDSALSVFADRKVKHLRKSANPIKRQWTPSASFGSTLIAPNGKKRVLCTACNKTFCDKGALKIHYSAVHLKEMHKCTVEGCNMMFSSRRSRNRHSANPNPKLHMPQKRKIPDGVTIIDSKTPSRLINSPPTMVVTSSFLHRNPITSLDSHDMSRNEQSCFVDITSSLSFLSTPEKRIKLENTEEAASSEAPDIKDKLQAEEMLKQDIAMQRGFNRRKSLIPTRCAQTEEMYIMSDENSSERDAVTGECGMHYCTNTKIVTDSVKTEYEMNTEKTDIKKEIPASPKPESTENKSSPKANSTVEVSGHGVICDINSSQKLEARKEACHFPRIASLLANTSTDPLDLSQDPCERSPSNISSTLSQGSDHDFNMSQSSTDSPAQTPTRTNGSHSPESSSSEIPLDKENPRKCTVCGKIFQNHFGVKTHYQNVHLKLMHTCTVEGCNAAFPSKRSRDRHSANLNLHRKLLSTSDMEGCEKDSLRDDILPKLYDSQTISTFADNSSEENENSPNSQMNNKSKGEVTSSGSQSDDSLVDDENALSPATGDHSYSSGGSPDNSGIGEDDMQADEFDSTVTCHVCQQKFKDNLVLKEHFETLHPKEMFHCTVSGCEKIFSTRKSRNRHSQNDNLHRHLSSTKTNGLS